VTLLERDREKIEEGREEAIKQLILKQYSKGLSIEYIAEINEFDVEYVKEVVKDNTSKLNN
jgi:predicted transposase YdaD